MKHKTSELTGALLDAAVAKALGGTFEFKDGACWAEYGGFERIKFCPSTDWSHGGPIIERERITIDSDKSPEISGEWVASCGGNWYEGPTPLIAACRAFVAHKLGDEVDL